MQSDTSEIPPRLALAIVDVDPDYLLLRVSAADGEFAGATSVYESPETLAALAAGRWVLCYHHFESFITSNSDPRAA